MTNETNNTVNHIIQNYDNHVIKSGCTIMNESVKRLQEIEKELLEARNNCSRKNLKIEDYNLEWSFIKLINDIEEIKNTTDNLTHEITRLTGIKPYKSGEIPEDKLNKMI